MAEIGTYCAFIPSANSEISEKIESILAIEDAQDFYSGILKIQEEMSPIFFLKNNELTKIRLSLTNFQANANPIS